MTRPDFRTPRLYHDFALRAGVDVPLDRDQANYLLNVLRLAQGDPVLLFNGRDGEWRATLSGTGKRSLAAKVETCLREQPRPGDLHFLFAPLNHARLDYMVQKAVELGVTRLQPVMTRHTQVARLNLERMRANAVEAAQQCGVLALPEVAEPMPFKTIAGGADPDRLLIFCDEDAEVRDPVAALAAGVEEREKGGGGESGDANAAAAAAAANTRIADLEKRLLRLQSAFADQVATFRGAVAGLLGWRVDMLPPSSSSGGTGSVAQFALRPAFAGAWSAAAPGSAAQRAP